MNEGHLKVLRPNFLLTQELGMFEMWKVIKVLKLVILKNYLAHLYKNLKQYFNNPILQNSAFKKIYF